MKVTFDDFMSLPSKERKRILNDPEEIKKLIRQNLSDHRYEHSLSTAETARMLAQCHHVDPDKAYMAGLLHDCTKNYDEKFHDGYLKYYDPDKLTLPEWAKHSLTARYYVREKLNYHDKDILNAMYNHTLCSSRSKLALIIFIADKREPQRGIDDDILETARKDLYKAFDMLQEDIRRYIEKEKNERFVENSL